MSFLTFNSNYYRQKLDEYGNKELLESDIYEIKQLLKVLDDLVDEGYTFLSEKLEEDFSCVSRLHTLLSKVKETPFSINKKPFFDISYSSNEIELEKELDCLIKESKEKEYTCDNLFVNEICSYSDWIGYKEKRHTYFY